MRIIIKTVYSIIGVAMYCNEYELSNYERFRRKFTISSSPCKFIFLRRRYLFILAELREIFLSAAISLLLCCSQLAGRARGDGHRHADTALWNPQPAESRLLTCTHSFASPRIAPQQNRIRCPVFTAAQLLKTPIQRLELLVQVYRAGVVAEQTPKGWLWDGRGTITEL